VEKNLIFSPFLRAKTYHLRYLNDDFQFQCSNRALLFDQKYKWHTFALIFFIFVDSLDPLSKNKSRIIIQKCRNFCKQLTLPGRTVQQLPFFKTVWLYTVKLTLCTYNYNILLLLITYVSRPPSIPIYSLQNICFTNDHGYVPFVEVTQLLWSHFWINFDISYTKTFGIVYILFVYLLIMFIWVVFIST
jgi:hypothetical protein